MSAPNLSINAVTPTRNQTGSLDSTLRSASYRIRLLMLIRLGSRVLCVSALACLLAVGISKTRIYEEPSPWIVGGLIAAALLVAVVFVFMRKLTPLDVAKITERRTDLKERLSSAVEFRGMGIDAQSPFYREQFLDAELYAGRVSIKEAYPIRIPREFWAGLAASLALFGLYFLPTLPVFWSPTKKAEIAELKVQAMKVIKISEDHTKTANQQDLKETKKAAAEAKKLGEAMEKAKLSKKESLIALTKLTRKMEETQKKMAEDMQRSMDKTKQAGNDFKKSIDKMQKEAEQKQKAEAEKNALQTKNNPPKPGDQNAQKNAEKSAQQKQSSEMKQAQQAMQQMAQALSDMNQKSQQQAMEKIAKQIESGKLSKEEMKQLQKQIQQLAKSMKDSGNQKGGEKMDQLAQQMQQSSGSMDAKTLQNMAGMAKSLGKEMGKNPGMGKDMLDAKTLGDLADALKGGRMTMAMGKQPGNGGKGPGRGYGGSGDPTKPMKDPDKTNPRLVAKGNAELGKGIGKTKDAKKFAEYAAMTNAPSKHLPNGKIAGDRSKNGEELQMNYTGDPEAFKSNAPYYQAYMSSKKQAESTLNKENIPAAYKKQVRDYFQTIKP